MILIYIVLLSGLHVEAGNQGKIIVIQCSKTAKIKCKGCSATDIWQTIVSIYQLRLKKLFSSATIIFFIT